MLTLLGSFLGFASSALPVVLNIVKERADRHHELEIIDRQMEQQRLGHTQRLEEIEVNADIQESLALYKHDATLTSTGWIAHLRASVRPMITYAFFVLFAAIKGCALYVLMIEQNVPVTIALPKIWDAETQALFAAVMSFWFGARAIDKFNNKDK